MAWLKSKATERTCDITLSYDDETREICIKLSDDDGTILLPGDNLYINMDELAQVVSNAKTLARLKTV